MSHRFYLFCNGIRSNSNDLQGWQFRAERWIERNTPDRADTYHYGVAAVARWVYQRRHVGRLSDIVKSTVAPERDVILVGHSNGCALICDALKACPDLAVRSIHLFAAAAHADCAANGLNEAAMSGRVGSVHLYGSRNDRALWLGGVSRRLFGWAGLGYGDIGRAGPARPTGALTKIMAETWRDDFGHSTWWTAPYFETSLRLIAGSDAPMEAEGRNPLV